MVRQTKTLFISWWLAPILTLLVLSGVSCEPGGELTIDNRYDQEIFVYATIVGVTYTGPKPLYGAIPPRSVAKTKGFIFTSPSRIFTVEIKDRQGRILFSKEMGLDDFQRINWKIIIEP